MAALALWVLGRENGRARGGVHNVTTEAAAMGNNRFCTTSVIRRRP